MELQCVSSATHTALTVGDKTYSAAEVQYSYYAAYSDVRSSSYFSYMGVDTSRSIGSQTMSDTAKMLCGVTERRQSHLG